MLCQIGIVLGQAAQAAGSAAATAATTAAAPGILSQIGTAVTGLLGTVAQQGLQIGTNYVQGLVNRELNRKAINDQNDLLKAQIRAASNVVSPTVAPGQGPVFSGGPPTGSAYLPATVLPPSPLPPAQILQINPEFSQVGRGAAPVTTSGGQLVRTGIQPQLIGLAPPRPVSGAVQAQPAFLGALARGAVTLGARGLQTLRTVGRVAVPGTGRPLRAGLGVAAGAVAAETAATTALDAILSPSTAFAPGRPQPQLPPLDPTTFIGPPMAPRTAVAPTPTGLPGVGRFQRDATGCQVQWYFFDGTNFTPIDRQTAKECTKKSCIYRLDVFRGKFVQLPQRRMNPMNTRAFFRAGRRIDAAERIARKLFSEKRKQKTGTIRRKATRRKKR